VSSQPIRSDPGVRAEGARKEDEMREREQTHMQTYGGISPTRLLLAQKSSLFSPSLSSSPQYSIYFSASLLLESVDVKEEKQEKIRTQVVQRDK